MDAAQASTLEEQLAIHTSLQCLPDEALVRILGAVPQAHRLGCCAAVCQHWRHATLAATPDLTVRLPDHRRRNEQAVGEWLAAHGRGLTSLAVSCPSWMLRVHIPMQALTQLQALSLLYVRPADGGSWPLSQLSALTLLRLERCCVDTRMAQLHQQLGALRQLRHLELLQLFRSDSVVEDPQDTWGKALAAALRQLTALTALVLYGMQAHAAVVGSLQALPQLQQLKLLHFASDDDGPVAISWADVPGTVTSLALSGRGLQFKAGGSSVAAPGRAAAAGAGASCWG